MNENLQGALIRRTTHFPTGQGATARLHTNVQRLFIPMVTMEPDGLVQPMMEGADRCAAALASAQITGGNL